MAIIQIPVGGVSVSVEIPDFATEYTMNEVLNEIRQQNGSLQSIASTSSRQAQVTQTNANNASNNNADSRGFISRAVNSVTGAVSKVMDNAGLTSDGAGAALGNLIGSLGPSFAKLGAAVGTAASTVESLSNVMGNLGRIGGNVGADLMGLRDAAADVGLGLTELSGYAYDYGTTLVSIGKNSTEGTRNLLSFVKTLRDTSADVGYFGLSSKELTSLMIDEIEIRRQNNDAILRSEDAAGQLSTALREQYIQQSAIARLTGQDYHDRIRARMEMEKDINAQAALAGATEDQRRAADAAFMSLTELGPAAQMFQQGFVAQMMMGQAALAPGMGEFMSLASGMGIDLQSGFEQMAAAQRAGDQETVNAIASQMAYAFKNLSDDNRRQLGVLSMGGGVQSASEMLGVVAQATPPVVEGLGNIAANADLFADAIARSRDAVLSDIESGQQRFLGIANDFEVITQNIQSILASVTLGVLGLSPGTQDVFTARVGANLQEAASAVGAAADTSMFANAIAAAFSNELQNSLGGFLTENSLTLGNLAAAIRALNARLEETQ